MTKLYAQPYDCTATGFFFTSADDYRKKAAKNFKLFGRRVEEYEIQFVDGDKLDAEFAKAFGLNQGNFRWFFECVDGWEDYEKILFIIAVGECGYAFDPEEVDPGDFNIDLYKEDDMHDLAIRFVEDGLFGEVPESFQYYIDYDAIARDLAIDYGETTVAGQHLIYRCG